MPQLFRRSVNADGDPPEWSPPDYATAVEDSGEAWKPPNYAEPVKAKEEPKKSVFSKVKEFLTPSDKLDVTKAISAQLHQFAQEHPYAMGVARRLISGPSKEELGGRELVGPGITKIPGLERATDYLSQKVTGSEGNLRLGLGAGVKALGSLLEGGFDPRTAGVSSEVSAIKPPIRRSLEETPYRFQGDLPSSVTENVPEVKTAIMQDYLKKNPDAKMADVKKFIESIPEQTPNEAALAVADKGIREQASAYNIAQRNRLRGTFEDVPSSEAAQRLEKERTAFESPFEKPAESKPTAEFAYEGPEGKMYNIKGGPSDRSTVGESKLKELGIDVPESPVSSGERLTGEQLRQRALAERRSKPSFVNPFENKAPEEISNIERNSPFGEGSIMPSAVKPTELKEEWQAPEYAKPVETPKIIEQGTPESLHPDLESLQNHGDGVLYLDFNRNKNITPEEVQSLFPDKNVEITDLPSKFTKNRFRVDIKGSDANETANQIEKSVGGSFNKITELHGGIGGISPSSRELNPNKGPYGAALDKLFNSMGNIKELRVQQDVLNKAERAKRFAAFSGVKDVGVKGAAESLSKLKGEFGKVDFDKLKMTQPQVDSLFTAVKRANITEGEKARGYTTLFKIFNGDLPQRNELRILDDVFGNGFADKFVELHGGIGAVGLKLSKAANTMKSMENSISLAAPLRHGIGLIHRKEFGPAFQDMFKFFGNKEYYDSAMEALQVRPNYLKGKDAGLFFAKPGSLQGSEEEFLNSYVGSLPRETGIPQAVAASQRGYTGFLNKLRSDTFDSMISKAEGLGHEMFTKSTDEAGNVSYAANDKAKAVAKYINTATGRGDLGSLNKMTNELNTLFWSPRMMASRFQMFDPRLYANLPKGMRIEGLKSLLGIASLGTVIDTLAAYGGAKVSTNILSTDFGKSRFGTKLIDPWGGLQQFVVGAARFLAGKTDSTMPTNRLEIAGRFLANKESPAARLAHTILTSKPSKDGKPGDITTQYNQKTSIQSEIAKSFVPIFVQDLQDLATNEPDFANNVGLDAAMGLASLAGMSQNYPEKKKLSLKKMKLR